MQMKTHLINEMRQKEEELVKECEQELNEW
jgi:hypothetical protein